MDIPEDGGSTLKSPGAETGKPSVGGMDIFWSHSLRIPNVLLYKV